MTNNMINANVASYIAYLINSKDCTEISMNSDRKCEFVSWSEHRVKWALILVRLAEFGIELPCLDIAQKELAAATESELTFANATLRTLEAHIEADAA